MMLIAAEASIMSQFTLFSMELTAWKRKINEVRDFEINM